MIVNDLSEVHIQVTTAASEAVANLLSELAGGGVEQRDHDTIDQMEEGQVEFVTWLPTDDIQNHIDAIETLLRSLGEMDIPVEPFNWRTEEADPDVWVDAYKKHFKTSRIGKHFIVKPSWESFSPAELDIVLELDPGMAFGTGLHASTKLVMKALERIARLCPAPTSIVDVGCGTGILAIAAAHLWSQSKIIAFDNDPVAVEVAKENIERNGMKKRIEVTEGSAFDFKGKYSLVLANVSYDVLSRVQAPLFNSVENFGRMILSGLLSEQAKELSIQYCRDLDLEPEYSEEDDGWRGLILRRRD